MWWPWLRRRKASPMGPKNPPDEPTPPPERSRAPSPLYRPRCSCGALKFTRLIYSRTTFQVKHSVLICPVCDLIERRQPPRKDDDAAR